MVISESVLSKINKDTKLLRYFNESQASDFMPCEVLVTFDTVSDARQAASLASGISKVIDGDTEFRMQGKKGAAVLTNIRAGKLADVIELDVVKEACVGKLFRHKPDGGRER